MNNLLKIFETCEVCKRYDKNVGKSCKFIEVAKPGEMLAISILESKKWDLVLVAIDYFSRKIWAKSITKKEAIKIVDFLIGLEKMSGF